ncbi:YigZ family protein [Moraxella sp. Tifton1]|uniref:YigZ family protein n=1 Tax=Moraxella oculi TaxID=2940516 RepID=A0ABW8U627_9GAMM|nr:YigZ family protein [Moraxella sp. Tifton1]MCL1624094.1 YigZ family protein [Moraxella sp. Tifton1]
MTYHTPSAPCQAIHEIKKSEFLAFAYPIHNKDEVMFHVEQLRHRYPDARHHCTAYIIGDPSNTTSAGFDDDGEPNGTAGRPILSVLQHKGIGNVLVVVVRYFGGIKLGAGGLTRAYATATQLLIDEMILVPFVAKSIIKVVTTFAHETQIRYLVEQVGGEIVLVDYAENVFMTVQMIDKRVNEFRESLGVFGRICAD